MQQEIHYIIQQYCVYSTEPETHRFNTASHCLESFHSVRNTFSNKQNEEATQFSFFWHQAEARK